MKPKKIAFREKYWLYIHIDYKQSASLVKALKKGGYKRYKPVVEDLGDDHKISVLIDPIDAADVISIFNIYT